MSRYVIDGYVVDSDDDTRLQFLLGGVYTQPRSRPRCLCARGDGIEMYVARVGEKYVLKRMPHSGAAHRPSCASYEPPAELSGLGEVLGSAIIAQPGGAVRLSLGFPLTRLAGRIAPTATAAVSARTDRTTLTPRAVLAVHCPTGLSETRVAV